MLFAFGWQLTAVFGSFLLMHFSGAPISSAAMATSSALSHFGLFAAYPGWHVRRPGCRPDSIHLCHALPGPSRCLWHVRPSRHERGSHAEQNNPCFCHHRHPGCDWLFVCPAPAVKLIHQHDLSKTPGAAASNSRGFYNMSVQLRNDFNLLSVQSSP